MAQLLLDVSSAHTRLALRIYFNVILPLLALIGDQCCRKRSQLRLLRSQTLDITQTTGWLRAPAAVYAIYSMRRSPAGWLGFMMVLAGILWLVSDLIVSALVVPTNVVDRCAFNTTGHYGTVKTNHTVGPFTPGNVGILWDQLIAARVTSLSNGGLDGIYRKVNSDPTFRADTEDIIGRWKCETAGNDVTYPARESQDAIMIDLYEKDLLYNYYAPEATNYIGINVYLQFLVWSSAVGNWDQNLTGTPDEIIDSKELHPWDVRAAVDISPNNTQPKVMRPFHCTMNAPAVEFVVGKVQPQYTLEVFISYLRGMIYGYFNDNVPLVTEPGVALATVLDQIVMSAALSHTDQIVGDPTQGCLIVRTQVPMSVILVWLLTTGVFLGVLGHYVHLTIVFRRVRAQKYSHAVAMAECVPNGLMGWMKQAVRESSQSSMTDYPHFKKWLLTSDAQQEALRLRHTHGVTVGAGHTIAAQDDGADAEMKSLTGSRVQVPQIGRAHV